VNIGEAVATQNVLRFLAGGKVTDEQRAGLVDDALALQERARKALLGAGPSLTREQWAERLGVGP
jgi:hypothetical protein